MVLLAVRPPVLLLAVRTLALLLEMGLLVLLLAVVLLLLGGFAAIAHAISAETAATLTTLDMNIMSVCPLHRVGPAPVQVRTPHSCLPTAGLVTDRNRKNREDRALPRSGVHQVRARHRQGYQNREDW